MIELLINMINTVTIVLHIIIKRWQFSNDFFSYRLRAIDKLNIIYYSEVMEVIIIKYEKILREETIHISYEISFKNVA